MIFTGAHLYYETVDSAYHTGSQPDRIDLANREQEVTLLQSKLIRFGVNQLQFSTVSGDRLSIDDVKMRFETNPLALFLPNGSAIHPQLALALQPNTVVISKVDRRSKPLRLVPRPNGG